MIVFHLPEPIATISSKAISFLVFLVGFVLFYANIHGLSEQEKEIWLHSLSHELFQDWLLVIFLFTVLFAHFSGLTANTNDSQTEWPDTS